MSLNFKPEAYFIDLDRTLLDEKKYKVSKRNIEAIKQKNKKTPVIISTGRAPVGTVLDIMNKANLPYAICQNGALIIDKNHNVLQEHTIDKDVVAKILSLINYRKSIVIINSARNLITNNLMVKLFFNSNKMWTITKPSENKTEKKISKLAILNVLPWRTKKIFWKIKTLFPDLNLKISFSDKVLEITNPESNKGLANSYVAKLLGIDPKKTVHIGDSMNDASTAGYMGALIATKNASKRLKKVATHIAYVSHKKAGVSRIINGAFYKK